MGIQLSKKENLQKLFENQLEIPQQHKHKKLYTDYDVFKDMYDQKSKVSSRVSKFVHEKRALIDRDLSPR